MVVGMISTYEEVYWWILGSHALRRKENEADLDISAEQLGTSTGGLVVTKVVSVHVWYTEDLLFNLFYVILDLFSIARWVPSRSLDLNNQ